MASSYGSQEMKHFSKSISDALQNRVPGSILRLWRDRNDQNDDLSNRERSHRNGYLRQTAAPTQKLTERNHAPPHDPSMAYRTYHLVLRMLDITFAASPTNSPNRKRPCHASRPCGSICECYHNARTSLWSAALHDSLEIPYWTTRQFTLAECPKHVNVFGYRILDDSLAPQAHPFPRAQYLPSPQAYLETPKWFRFKSVETSHKGVKEKLWSIANEKEVDRREKWR